MSFQVGNVSLPSLLVVRLGFNIALSSLCINFLLALSHSFGLEVCPFFNHPNLQIFLWEQGCLLFHFLVSPLSLSLSHAHTHTCTRTRARAHTFASMSSHLHVHTCFKYWLFSFSFGWEFLARKQVLVLDEADRILDVGFKKALNAIVSQLPKNRQTLLFSATQTKSVQDLARLSLKDPEYLSVHEESVTSTPNLLQQTAMVVPLDQKLDMLWSFIKSHLNSKILVFLSSCKQVT